MCETSPRPSRLYRVITTELCALGRDGRRVLSHASAGGRARAGGKGAGASAGGSYLIVPPPPHLLGKEMFSQGCVMERRWGYNLWDLVLILCTKRWDRWHEQPASMSPTGEEIPEIISIHSLHDLPALYNFLFWPGYAVRVDWGR